MVEKHLRVSLVIPAYNEEHHLKACLEGIAVQDVHPYEVIVVDNASTDQTASIARSYDFVKLITEERRGVVFARDTGFNAATGDIIGRIDSDTLLPPDWTAKVRAIFSSSSVAAVSGSIHYYDQVFWRAGDKIDNFCRKRLAKLQARSNSVFLQGANLAMRRDTWLAVRDNVCHLDGIHEDFDLAIHLQLCGFRVEFDERLRAGISSRRADSDFFTFARYLLVCPRSYAVHGLRSRVYMYPVGMIWMAIYMPSYVGYRGFDPATGRFSLEKLLTPRTLQPRLDPSTILE